MIVRRTNCASFQRLQPPFLVSVVHVERLIAVGRIVIIKAAGLKPRPKLRASRATELAAEYPGHVAADWLGHGNAIADKRYCQVTEADFARALQKSLPMPADEERTEANEKSDARAKSRRTTSFMAGSIGARNADRNDR